MEDSLTPQPVIPSTSVDQGLKKIWDYFKSEKGGQSATCISCNQVLKTTNGGTTGLYVHLKTRHQISVLKRTDLMSGQNNSAGLITQKSTVKPKQPKITKFIPPLEDKSTEAVISRLTAKDGLSFAVICSSLDLRQLFRTGGCENVPQTPQVVGSKVVGHAKKIRGQVKEEIGKLRKSGRKFSVTFDEWTSKRNRRYINVNVHLEDFTSSLGLVRIHGSAPAEKCLDLVTKRLTEFDLSLRTDIVSIGTDGASVMTKVGRLSPIHQQHCYAHGIQLAVMDVLYANPNKSNNTEPTDATTDQTDESVSEGDSSEDEEDSEALHAELATELVTKNDYFDEVCLVPNDKLRPLIEKVRLVVRKFRKSPTKNDEILLKHTMADFGRELTLTHDSRTRWSSLYDMIERFVMLKMPVLKSLVDMESEISSSEAEWHTLSSLANPLEPVKLTVEVLCRRETNLLTADAALKFMLSKLEEQDTPLSMELHSSLEFRIKQRRTQLSGVLEFLLTGKHVNRNSTFSIPSVTAMATIMKDLITRFNGISQTPNVPDENLEVNEVSPSVSLSKRKPKTALQLELEEALNKATTSAHSEKSQAGKNLLSTIRSEISLFQAGGSRGFHIQMIYDSLKTIRPTSVESERAFSAAGYLVSKVRARLNDGTIDSLCFLRSHYQMLEYQTKKSSCKTNKN